MYPLIRRYLRRVDVFYLLLCAACSALSVVVLVSIGQTQLGSNNKASVQLIASLLGLMLAVVFSTADYHALARAWPLHAVVAWGLVLPTLFLHNVNTGLVTIGYDAGGTSNYSWYRVGGMTFQPAELAKISFILTLALHLSNVRGQVNKPKNLLLLLLHIGLPAAAIHVQGDDGTALVFLGIGLVMLFAGGLSHWLVAGGLAAGAVGGAALLVLARRHAMGYGRGSCNARVLAVFGSIYRLLVRRGLPPDTPSDAPEFAAFLQSCVPALEPQDAEALLALAQAAQFGAGTMTEQDTDKMRKLYQVIKHTGKRKQSQKSVEKQSQE